MARRLLPAAAAAFCVMLIACSEQYTSGVITVSDPWGRATPAGADVGAGYMTIANSGSTPIRLIGGTTDVANAVEVHTMSMENGVMQMRPLSDGLEVPAGGSATLKPGGDHLMLVGLKRQLNEGEIIAVTLDFDKGVVLPIKLAIKATGAEHGH